MASPIVQQLHLEAMQYALQTYITKELCEDLVNPPQVKLMQGLLGDTIVIQVRGVVLGLHKKRVVSFESPATWWDAFKKEAIPTFTRWLKLKVNHTVQMYDARAVFPHLLPHQSVFYFDPSETYVSYEEE